MPGCVSTALKEKPGTGSKHGIPGTGVQPGLFRGPVLGRSWRWGVIVGGAPTPTPQPGSGAEVQSGEGGPCGQGRFMPALRGRAGALVPGDTAAAPARGPRGPVAPGPACCNPGSSGPAPSRSRCPAEATWRRRAPKTPARLLPAGSRHDGCPPGCGPRGPLHTRTRRRAGRPTCSGLGARLPKVSGGRARTLGTGGRGGSRTPPETCDS